MSFGEMKREAGQCQRLLLRKTVTGTVSKYWGKLDESVALAEDNVWRRQEILAMAAGNFASRLLTHTIGNVVTADQVHQRIGRIARGNSAEPAEELLSYLTVILSDARTISETANSVYYQMLAAAAESYNHILMENVIGGIALGTAGTEEYNVNITQVDSYFDRFIGSL